MILAALDAGQGQLIGQVTGHPMVGRGFAPGGNFLAANGLGITAAGMELTACRRIGRAGHISGQDNTLFGRGAGVGARDGREQGFGVRMQRFDIKFIRRG